MVKKKRKSVKRKGVLAEGPTHIEWTRHIRILQDFLDKLDRLPSMHGKVWSDKMKAHYGKRMVVLREAEPPFTE